MCHVPFLTVREPRNTVSHTRHRLDTRTFILRWKTQHLWPEPATAESHLLTIPSAAAALRLMRSGSGDKGVLS
jgi:hypothetical protein